MKMLSGKAFVVTGASRGVGKGIALDMIVTPMWRPVIEAGHGR